MLTPSNKLFYAVEAVLYIAYNAKSGPVSGKEIASRQNLPPRYLEPMLQKLVRSGILRGVRGPQGGYTLGRERRRIAVSDVCDALAEDATWPKDSTALGTRVLKQEADALVQQFHKAMGDITIAGLCDRAQEQKIATSHANVHDFTI